MKKTVLLTEDDQSTRETLSFFVESLGYECLCAVDGKEATAILASHHVDVLMTDFMLPRMDGVELLNWCRKENLHFPVIFFSANADLVDREKIALQDCCATLMMKPFQLTTLQTALRAADTRDHHADCVHRRETPVRY
jgi:DNA-binding response OmpR family regulator